jgi:hypothetical protein
MMRPPLTDAARTDEFNNLREEYALQGPEPGTRWTDPMQFNAIFELVIRWLETRDPAFMDHALLYCHGHGLPVRPCLMAHVVDSVKLRQTWEKTEKPKPQRETIKGEAFQIMANLIARGLKKSHASEIAAVWTSDIAGRAIKASTLEAGYNKTAWPKTENELRALSDADNDARWHAFVEASRPITCEERGNRRQ